MSLKENIEYVKDELSAQESFMEKFFKFEQFYKKQKKAIIAIVVLAIVATIGYYTSSYISEQNKLEANKAFNKILENKDDKEALAILKEKNQKLYNIALFMEDPSSENSGEFLKELSLYAKAIKEQNIEKITTLTQNQDFLLKDFALFNKALIEVELNKYTEAKETLKQISEKSNLDVLVKMLEHHLLTK